MNSVLKKLTNKLKQTANNAVDGLSFTERELQVELARYSNSDRYNVGLHEMAHALDM
jgi:hypothetical protein